MTSKLWPWIPRNPVSASAASGASALTVIQTNHDLTLDAGNTLVEVIESNKTVTLPLVADCHGQTVAILGTSGQNVGIQAQADDVVSSRGSPVAGQGQGPWHPSGNGAVLFAGSENTWATVD